MDPADSPFTWSSKTRPILKPGVQPTGPGVREQITKIVDHLRSEMEHIRVSNHSIEVTMAALETIQQRHPRPADTEATEPVPLTRSDLKEYMRMKREQMSPGLLAPSDLASDSSGEFEDVAPVASSTDDPESIVVDERDGSVLEATSTASSQAMTEVSSTGLGDVVPSDDIISDDSSDGTEISSTGLAREQSGTPSPPLPTPLGVIRQKITDGTEISTKGFPGEQSWTPSPPSPTPPGVIRQKTTARLGPIRFPSRQRPMPMAVNLPSTPSLPDSSSPHHSTGTSSGSSIIATSPIPQVTQLRRGLKPPRTAAAADILDLTLSHQEAAAGKSGAVQTSGSKHSKVHTKQADGAARLNQRPAGPIAFNAVAGPSGSRGILDLTLPDSS